MPQPGPWTPPAQPKTRPPQPNTPPPQEEPPPAQPKEERPEQAVQGLVIEFDTGSGGSGVEKVAITKKPLGMTFDKRVPIKITKLNERGSALEAGVKVGYLIRSINGKETDGRTFEECLAILQEGVAKCTVVQSRQVS
jgi:hypothetical protein